MLIGHEKQLEFLRDSFKAGKASHAYLFSGPSELGKKTLALTWLSEIFYRENHPDLILIDAQGEEIKISQIRALIWKLSLKSYLSDSTSEFYPNLKAAVINNAHLMNSEAQNALLKTLEEPKGNVFIFLITDQPDSLLTTIVSRAQTVKFYPVSENKISEFLSKKKGLQQETAQELSRMASGRPGRAIGFAEDSLKMDSFLDSLKEIKKISESDICYRFQYAKTAAEDIPGLKNSLDVWLDYFRNILLGGGGQDFQKYSFPKLKKIIQNIQETKKLIVSTNANVRLALEVLLMDM